MKYFFSILFIMVLFFNSNAITKFDPPVDSTTTIVVGFTNSNPNTKIANVKEFIQNMSGVNSVVFCSNHSCFIINLNRSLVIYAKEGFTNQISAIFPQDSFIIKGEASEIVPFCTFNDPVDAQFIKSK